MTIKTNAIESLKTLNVSFLKTSSCWDIRHNNFGPTSQVRKDMQNIFAQDENIKELTIVIGAKGRSEHSKTELLIFNSTNKTALVGTVETGYRDFYTYQRPKK
jgi:hypothetical protein